jgi:hypothetical protein
VFFLEEPSARDALEAWLPQLVPAHVLTRFIVFQGKQDLKLRLAHRIAHWLLPDSHFLVLLDQDREDCRALKRELTKCCQQAGRPQAVVRIACRELEAFFMGDWNAIARAFDRPALAKLASRAAYRDPDRVQSPSRELQKHIVNYQKRDGARRIAPLIDLEGNRSASFQALRLAILSVATGADGLNLRAE